MKVYNKRGVHNYKEKKLEEALQAFFEKNPDKIAGYTVPSNYEDLKATHDNLCIESVEFTETKNEKPENKETHENFRDSMAEGSDDHHHKVDPMNRDEPIIRDYVKNDGFKEQTDIPKTESNYDEPTNFKDSFEIPDNETLGGNGNNGPKEQIHTPPPKPKPAGPPDPDAKLKKKSKRKFTKYAVDAFCALSGRVMVWYATKDITDQKLDEYIANDEIARHSLEMIVTLDNGTRGTIRQFFQSQCFNAQQLAQFTPEEKEDLAEAFDDYLEYKKVEINPTINMAVIIGGMMLQRLLGILEIKAIGKSVLEQIKDQYNAYKEDHTEYATPAQENETPSPQQDEGPLPDENEELKNANDLTETDLVK